MYIKKIMMLIVALSAIFIMACDESDSNTQTSSEEAIKYYTPDPIPDADFYYWTESGLFYRYHEGEIKRINMTAKVEQEGYGDRIEKITPTEFYKLGDYYFFIFEFNDEDIIYRQLYGEIEEVGSLMRHPDIVRREMNNGRFSIETNTVDIYTVSDIRNLTLSLGIRRTHKCTAYHLGDYNLWDYGLFFVAEDNDLSVITSGLYYLPETDESIYKIVDEPGEMW